MKKYSVVFLLVAMIFSFAGCSSLEVPLETKSSFAEWTDKAANDASSWVKETAATIEDAGHKAEEKTVEIVHEVKDAVEDTVENTVENTVEKVSDSAKKGTNALSDVLSNLGKKTQNATEKVGDAVSETAKTVEKETQQIVEYKAESSNFVLIVILVAIGLTGVAIAYYCITLKKKNGDKN